MKGLDLIGRKYNETKNNLIVSLINNELNWEMDNSRNYACYFTQESTKYIIRKDDEIYPISLKMIMLINDVRIGKKKYIDNSFVDN